MAAERDPLIAGLVAGRDDAFAALFDRFGPSLLRVAHALLSSRHDAEDVVQEVFVGVVRARATLGSVENLRAYLFASLRRAALKRAARRGKERGAPFADVPAPQCNGIGVERAADLERALAALPAEQRELIALKVDADLTFVEIADLLGISANTAASRYRYALDKLRSALGQSKHEPDRTARRP
jgi:RNA polymerase sigma-70 factor (ECF subfamily)